MAQRRPDPSEEEFQAWRDNPVTRWVMGACLEMAEANRVEWERISWEGGKADWQALLELRTRADAYRALIETDYAGWKGPEEAE